LHSVCLSYLRRDSGPFSLIIEIVSESPVLGMDEATSNQEDAALSLSDGGPLGRVWDPGGLESENLTLRSGSILRGRTPHTSQMGDSQALTEFDMVTVQGQTGLSPSESETVTSYTVSAAAADLSLKIIITLR